MNPNLSPYIIALSFKVVGINGLEGQRYDVGDKFGFIKATIDFSLNRDDLKDQVQAYLKELISTLG